MNTIEEFEDAQFGRTAINSTGVRAFKGFNNYLPWVIESSPFRFSNEEMVEKGFTLDPLATDLQLQSLTLWTDYGRVHIAPGHDPEPAPTTAQEALDLAWELAHEVKEGQVIPVGTRYVRRSRSGGLATFTASEGWTPTPRYAVYLRTLDPLPDPEPDWLDAPAVLATDDRDRRGIFFPVADRDKYWQSAQTGLHYHWSDLTDVTPLYPKEDQ